MLCLAFTMLHNTLLYLHLLIHSQVNCNQEFISMVMRPCGVKPDRIVKSSEMKVPELHLHVLL